MAPGEDLTQAEINRVLWGKWPSWSPQAKRRSKLKMRFKGAKLDEEIEKTWEKLKFLMEIREERYRASL